MIKYYCDVCGKEINSWFHEWEASMQNPYRTKDPKKIKLHFHDECLKKMSDYLSMENLKEEWTNGN